MEWGALRQLKQRWPLAALSLIVTLALLYGGHYLFVQRTVAEPLARRYAELEAVLDFTTDNGRGGRKIVVALAPVHDLQTAYGEVAAATAAVLGEDAFALQVTDGRNADLQEAYHRMHLALHEGISTGQLRRMEAEVAAVAAELGLSHWRLSVDASRLYLQLHADTAYLYAVLPRPAALVRGGARDA